MGFEVKAYTERLDKIAESVEKFSPALAYQIDKVSDVLEGKKEASTLKFDADEARYMADRFNFNVRKQDADEPYMADYNKSNFSQTSDAYAKMPGHAKGSVEAPAPAEAPAPKKEEEVEAKKEEKPVAPETTDEKPVEKPAEMAKEAVNYDFPYRKI